MLHNFLADRLFFVPAKPAEKLVVYIEEFLFPLSDAKNCVRCKEFLRVICLEVVRYFPCTEKLCSRKLSKHNNIAINESTCNKVCDVMCKLMGMQICAVEMHCWQSPMQY